MKRTITNKHLTILIILIGLVLFVTSCDNDNDNKTVTSDSGSEYEVITIDGCEYLVKSDYHQGYFAHKGNCKNH